MVLASLARVPRHGARIQEVSFVGGVGWVKCSIDAKAQNHAQPKRTGCAQLQTRFGRGRYYSAATLR